MQLNNYTVIDRNNRPSINQRIGLRSIFINDGVFQDPYDISSVVIFRRTNNLSPSSILNSNGLIDTSAVSSLALMTFGVSSHTNKLNSVALDASDYNPGTAASGVYRTAAGQYMAVLDGTVALSGNLSALIGVSRSLANGVSAIGDYIDVWTVKLSQNSDYKTFINDFTMWDDTFFVLTEPLMLKVMSRLTNKRIIMGSKVDMKVTNEINIENRNIDESIRNIFRDSVITSAVVEIKKQNQEPNLAARVTVSSFSDTVGYPDVTSDNTIIFTFDTNGLLTHAQTLAGNMGSLVGTYSYQVKFNLLNETIISPLMFFEII
jgi:hypothetical protein